MPELTRLFTEPRPKEGRTLTFVSKPVCLVVHAMMEYIAPIGSLDRIEAWKWLEDHDKLSAHALIHPDGQIVRGKEDSKIAWHAGKSQIVLEGKTFTGLNQMSLGAEWLVKGEGDITTLLRRMRLTDAYTEAQYESGAILYAGWCEQFSLPVERIVAHSFVSGPDVRPDPKHDPGEGFNWPLFRELVQAQL